MAPPTFEVRVGGTVPEPDLLDLAVVTLAMEAPSTVLYGEIRDEAALFGLLGRLRDLGIEVLEVRRNPDLVPLGGDPPGQPPETVG